jgi:hypothetical protein
MSNKATEDKLDSLHGALAQELTTRIKDGDKVVELIDCDGHVQEHEKTVPVGANILSVARQFLKDNHIEAGADNKPLADLVDSLPFDEAEQEDTSAPFN